MDAGGGDWVRGRLLGRGAEGEVHVAAAGQRRFAVKSGKAAALRRELEILSSVKSSHVVGCLGADVSGEDCRNLFLEYLPGGSLGDAVRCGGRLGEGSAGGFAKGILSALVDLHSAGVAHCDVKAHNVLLTGRGTVKLADFGCAVRGRRAGGSAMAGTPLFMAPEVARGEGQGPESDIWALGCTVVEMVTGRPPWTESADPVSALHRIGFSGETPAVPAFLSAAAKDFLMQCFERDPRRRPTAAALLCHSFVAAAVEEGEEKEESSPKSVLEEGLWLSVGTDDDDGFVLSTSSESALERVKALAGPSSGMTDDEEEDEESWMDVRTNVIR